MADVDMTDAPTAPAKKSAGKAKVNDGGAGDKKRFEVKKASSHRRPRLICRKTDYLPVECGRLMGMGYCS